MASLQRSDRAQHPVTIVGAGMAGAACAVALQASGIAVRIVDRALAPGGRLASPVLHGRRVDVGAGYFTVRDAGLQAVVDGWAVDGLARPWTDTFAILAPDEVPTTTSGPMRWAAPGGLHSLVTALLDGVDVVKGTAVDSLPPGDVVLAMPDPQAARLVELGNAVDYDPVIAVACGFDARTWSFADAAFVHGHPDVEFIADDGARRGDGAAVLVAHTSSVVARRHLDEPGGAIAPTVAALQELLGTEEPRWTSAHRWRFAKPAAQHDRAYGFARVLDGRRVGLAGDQWCPQGRPRVESAWRSGTDLGAALAAR